MIIKNKYFLFPLIYFLSNCIFLSKIYAEDAFSAAIQAFGQDTYISNNDMLYLSLNNCNALTEVCLDNTCINVCKAKNLTRITDFGKDNLIIYTQLKNCPIGFIQDKNLDIIIEDPETLEQTYYNYCRASSNQDYKMFAGHAPDKSIPMLQLFQGNKCPFGQADVWIETAEGKIIVGCYDKNSSAKVASTNTESENDFISSLSDSPLCSNATYGRKWKKDPAWNEYVEEAKRRGLTCGVDAISSIQVTASSKASTQSNTPTSADTQIPLITITRADTDDKQGIIAGRVSDNVGVAEVTADGNVVPFSNNGSFEYSTYVPATGLSVIVEVTDLSGLSSSQTVTLKRNVNLATASISFDRLNPIAKPAKRNSNALALIIGVSDYENTPAKAIYADTDAMVFHDYASEKLGIPDNRIKTLVNDGADIRQFLLSTKNWLSRSVKQDQTDVYVFFAGHGLASDDGQHMYLLPYDGSPELLDKTAILRDELFSDIASANPRSVTVFLDTCYSGSTRGSEMLIAARPILLKAKESAVPEGFTVFTAAAGDETAKPLEEAEHGMFSYFLMKGMEGDADTNGDKHITAGELHAYVKSNVVQQSSGTQTPELQGDADRVLVRFQ